MTILIFTTKIFNETQPQFWQKFIVFFYWPLSAHFE